MKVALFVLFCSIGFFVKGQTEVRNVMVEQQSFPLGIATATPRFSWQLYSEKRAVRQQSYEILIATSKENLQNNNADVWASGKIASANTILVPYKGNRLHANKYYYAKIKVTTNKGEVLWSKPVFFTIGFLNSSDWKARWIGYDKPFPWDSISQWSRLSARYYRKEFNSTKKIKKAFVNIVGLGMYELFINGKRIGDQVLAPTPTDYRKTVLSNTFDVTEHILNGKNAIGVTLGNGRFFTMRQNYKPHKINNFGFPKLLCQLNIFYEDGEEQLIVSDETWRFAADGPIRSNNEYDGEIYDATKELGAWTEVGYNESKWMKAFLVDAPDGKIVPQSNPPMKIMQVINPVAIHKLNDSVHVLDMGQNFSGWLQFSAAGKKGHNIKLRFAESLQPDGSLYVANLRDARVTDVYTMKGNVEEIWHPKFVYHGFRYVEITNWPGKPILSNFEGHLVYDQMSNSGTFSTSNTIINSVFKNAWWGIASNYKGMPVDCPQRNERQPWLGDRAQGAYGESFLFNNAALYAKWLDDIEDAQTPDGAIPDVAPAFWNYYSDNITWPATYILVADMLYNQYGDMQSVSKHYKSMKKWMTYMKSKYMKNFIISKDKYGDWCVPPEDLKMIRSKDSTRITNGGLLATAYYYRLLDIMKQFANLTGNSNDVVEFENLRKHIKSAFNKKFFRDKLGQYDNGTVTANLLPLYFGLTPEDKKQFVFDNILKKLQENKMHISTGVIGTQWLMRGLTQYDRVDAAFTLASNKTYPSWGYMVENGATTIWELWNGNTANPQMNSQNHIMLLGDLLIWFYENVAGIAASKPAWKTIKMKPAFDIPLQKVEASYQSVAGIIKSAWTKNNNKINWEIEVPANVQATIYLPAANATVIKESGKNIMHSEGITFRGISNGNAIIDIESGHYSFSN